MTALTPETVSAAVAKLGLMAFFPSDPEVRVALVPILMDMIDTKEQLDWLTSRALKLYPRWPGVSDIRALYCSRYKPKDGEEAYSEIYQDGFPSERPAAAIPPKRATTTTADAEFAGKIKDMAKVKRFPGRADKTEAK